MVYPENVEKISKPILGHWKNFTTHLAIHEYMYSIAVTFIKPCTESLKQVNAIVEQVNEIVSQKKAKNNSCWKKQCRLDFFVKKSLEISSQSDSMSSESDSEEG